MSLVAKFVRGPYFRDLLAQPTAVEATLRSLERLEVAEDLRAVIASNSKFDRIVLTGMGSSLAALHPLALRLIATGTTAMVVDTSDLLYGMAGLLATPEAKARTLVIAVSQSGQSAEIVRLVEREDAPTMALVAVTNTPDSPLAKRAKATILTQAGKESTVSCRTYVATLVALARLGDVLTKKREGAEGLWNAPQAMTTYLSKWEAHMSDLAPLTEGVRDVFLAGRGASLAAVHTAGLIIKESARVHAEGMTSAALRHGPMEMSADHVLALIYDGDANVQALNRTLVADLKKAGMRAHSIGEGAEPKAFRLEKVPLIARPLVEILPAQMLSLALAAQQGIEAGRFTHASKVTSTE